MATYIKTLKEDNGDITYPQTKAGAVYTDEGSDVQTVLDDCTRFEEIASTSTLSPTTTSSMVSLSRSVVNVVLTSQTNTSWSANVQVNKIEWGNGVVEYCCNNLNTTFGASTSGEKNIMVNWPTQFTSIWGSSINAWFDGNATAYLCYNSVSSVRADIWVMRGAGSTVQNLKLSFRVIGVIS